MSVLLYIASDTPLAEVKNPHYKTLSVNEALAAGMNDIPDFMLEPEFDRDCPGALLWSDTEIKIDTENNSFDDGQLDDDFAILNLDETTEDIFTRKKYRVYIEWNYTSERAKNVITYIRKHLEKAKEIELWRGWLGGGVNTHIIRHAIPIDALTPEVLERIESLDISIDTPTQHCFVLSK